MTALLPDAADPVSAPFWEGLRRGVVTVQACEACGELRYPPLARCPECSDPSSRWTEVRPVGTVWSFAVYHRALHPAFADEVPYTVVVVELDEGPRITARLSLGSRRVEVGERVLAEFTRLTDDVTLLSWRPE